jgi:hypothetical protein
MWFHPYLRPYYNTYQEGIRVTSKNLCHDIVPTEMEAGRVSKVRISTTGYH